MVFASPLFAQLTWPHPIPCRIHDGSNPDVMVMTLGDVQTTLVDGVFDPVNDRVTLNDGAVIQNYFKDSLGVEYFSPIDKTNFPLPPSGWCSWYYYYQEINEEEIRRNAKWIADNLKDFGANYVQIDDGWQGTGRGLGENRDWTIIDKRFSGGMDKLAAYIKSLGLTPGIWLAPHGQSNMAVIDAYPNVFLRKPDGTSAADTWEGKFLVDPSTPETQTYLKDLFATLAGWGYDYFKIDGQPIVVREFREKKEFMKNPTDDTNALYRQTLDSMREAIGPNRYLLGCWVVPLEGIGIMNGSRTSADVEQEWKGFKVALRSTMRYFFLHNIAWYCDPDVMIVRSPMPFEQAQAWATLQGLTGQALMSSDRLMDLSDDRVELMRRVYPAVDIRPMDLFSSHSNKRVWDLKINHLGRQYDVVGLFNFEREKSSPVYVSWQDLDLPSDKPIHIFDFWNQEYLGAWEKGLALDLPPTSCRVLALLPDNDQIQLISTSRHITQGWVDLLEVKHGENSNAISGKSKLVKNDRYALHFAFPRGKNFVVENARANSATENLPVKISNHDGWASLEFVSPQNDEVSWQVAFAPAEMYHFPTKPPEHPYLWAERVGFNGVNLRWPGRHQPWSGHLVSVNGELLGFTPNTNFPLRNLNMDSTYSVEVRTAWQDGSVSEEAAPLKFNLRSMVPDELYLSDLEPYRIGLEWRQAEFDRTILGKGMVLGGKRYERGLGIPSNSELGFDLEGRFATFTAIVGVDEEHNREGHVEFVVIADDTELWRSGFVTKSDGAIPVKLDISGVHHLVLRVNRGEKGGSGDQANWVEAKVSRKNFDGIMR
jgi:hypothetical protein